MLKRARKALRRLILGDIDLPQQCTVPMRDPQNEVEVWLHGPGVRLNVTDRHMIACAAPPIIAVGQDAGCESWIQAGAPLFLKIHERGGRGVLLGQIRLGDAGVLHTKSGRMQLFEALSCENYCVPRLRLWGYLLFQAWLRTRNPADPDVPMTARAAHAMTVLFTCPRPVVLVSVQTETGGNMFPMNLMGPVQSDYFAFALNSRRRASALVERAGALAVSSIPFEQAGLARQLGKNHRRDAVDWSTLPFRVTPSQELGLPVPGFAARVRELEIESIRNLGSHTLFVARVIRDEHCSETAQFFMVHGLYQAWRQKQDRAPVYNPVAPAQNQIKIRQG